MFYPKILSPFKRDEKGDFLCNDFYDSQYESCVWTCPEFELLRSCPWDWYEKVDGTNTPITVTSQKNGSTGYLIGGRTARAEVPQRLIKGIQEDLDIGLLDRWVKTHNLVGADITLFGEGYGASIQKGGGNYSDGNHWVMFDVVIDNHWLLRENLEEVAESLNVDIVQQLPTRTLNSAIDEMICDLTFESAWPNVESPEGMVGHACNGLLRNRKGHRIAVKLKYKDFIIQ